MFLRHTSLPAAPGGVQLTVVPTNRLARQLRKESIMSSGPGAIVPPYFHTLETLARSTYLSIPRLREILTGPARLFFLQAAVRQIRDVAGFGPSHGTIARMLPAITLLEERGITADTMTRELPSIAHHERQRLKNVVLYYSGQAGKRLSPQEITQ